MRAEDLASWCLLTGQAPDAYYALTALERDTFVRLAKRR